MLLYSNYFRGHFYGLHAGKVIEFQLHCYRACIGSLNRGKYRFRRVSTHAMVC